MCDDVAYFSRLFDFDWRSHNVSYNNMEGENVGWLGGGGIDFNFFSAGIVRDYSVAMAGRIRRSEAGAGGGGGGIITGGGGGGKISTRKRRVKYT